MDGFSEAFASCAGGDIVVWNRESLLPVLRISFPRLTCLSIELQRRGSMLISGWSDDAIRFFDPCLGRLLHRIDLGHASAGVTALASSFDCDRLVSGAGNGLMRVWSLRQRSLGQVEGTLAYHYRAIHRLRINPHNPLEAVACCEDGTFSLWDLSSFELKLSAGVASFLKDAIFLEEFRLLLFGAGACYYEGTVCGGFSRRGVSPGFTNAAVLTPAGLLLGGEESQLHQVLPGRQLSCCVYGEVTALALSGNRLAVGTSTGTMLLFELLDHDGQAEQAQSPA